MHDGILVEFGWRSVGYQRLEIAVVVGVRHGGGDAGGGLVSHGLVVEIAVGEHGCLGCWSRHFEQWWVEVLVFWEEILRGYA